MENCLGNIEQQSWATKLLTFVAWLTCALIRATYIMPKRHSKSAQPFRRLYAHNSWEPGWHNTKAQLSLTNPRDTKACQKLLQLFDVLTTLSLTIQAYLHAFSCCCVRNLRNREKFTENSNLWSSRSSKVIDFGANRKPTCDLLLVINSNFSRICYRFRDIHG